MNHLSAVRHASGRSAAQPLPFEDILAPIVARAIDGVAPGLDRFGSGAGTFLARSLLLRLSQMCGPVLLEAFDRRRPRGPQLLARFLEGESRVVMPRAAFCRDLYDAFVEEMTASGFERLLDDYSVLREHIADEVDAFRVRTLEMCRRLEVDLPELVQAMGWQGEPGEIVSLRTSLSDPHRHGRSVSILTFESGAKIVYKPRNLDADAAFHAFLALCDETAFVPKFLLRPGYGWMEVVEPTERDGGERDFPLSAAFGRLLAVLYMLGATDCHWENLIVRDRRPVLIDAETVLQPPPLWAATDKSGLGDPWPWDTVLRTGLLPVWLFSADGGGACDASALGRLGEIRGAFQAPRWRDINSDAMTLADEPATLRPVPGTSRIDVDALLDGFAAMYRSLVARRAELIQSEAFRDLGTMRLRFVARPTYAYAQLLRTSFDPASLADPEGQRLRLGTLPALTADADPAWQAVREAELQALARRDVPLFTIDAEGGAVEACNGERIAVPLRSPFADTLLRFDRMGEPDLARQTALIRASFQAIAAKGADPGARFATFADAQAIAGSTSRDLMAAALSLAEDLASGALISSDGSAEWLGLHLHEASSCFSLQRLDPFLYEGNAGVALFLAAAAALGGRADLGEAALAALAPVRRGRPDDADGQVVPLGVGTGVGSLVYALTRCAHFLGRDELLDDASRIAAGIDDGAIAAEPAADALGGLAGAVIGLLALFDATGKPEILERAVAAGRRLLAIWEQPPLYTGLAHGAAGIALAFARLGRASGETEFGKAARRAIAFERDVFDSRAGAWPDLRFAGTREDGGTPCSTMWCHGAPGIGLGRLALLAVDDDPLFLPEIEAAIAATSEYGLRSADHLCCGNFGRIDLLVEASLGLGRSDLHDLAIAAATLRLDRFRKTGSFGLSSDDAPDALKPSLFRGVAGIGYELLRLAAPREVPTVLTWN